MQSKQKKVHHFGEQDFFSSLVNCDLKKPALYFWANNYKCTLVDGKKNTKKETFDAGHINYTNMYFDCRSDLPQELRSK